MNYFCDFLEEFSCKLAPVLQKGSLSFLFLCCRRKNEFTAEDFLFYTTGCALRVSCVCFPGEVRPLLCAYFAAAYCCITPHPFDSCGGIPQNAKMCKFWYGNPMAFVRKKYGKSTAKIRNLYGKAAGSKISRIGVGLIIIFILRFTYNESIQYKRIIYKGFKT